MNIDTYSHPKTGAVFECGQTVQKRKGYPFYGTIVALYNAGDTPTGPTIRAAVRGDVPGIQGVQHIYNLSQLEHTDLSPMQWLLGQLGQEQTKTLRQHLKVGAYGELYGADFANGPDQSATDQSATEVYRGTPDGHELVSVDTGRQPPQPPTQNLPGSGGDAMRKAMESGNPFKKPKRPLSEIAAEIAKYRETVSGGDTYRHDATGGLYIVRDVFMDKFSQAIHISYTPCCGADEEPPEGFLEVPIAQPIERFLDGRMTLVSKYHA